MVRKRPKKPRMPPKRYVWRIERDWLGWYVRLEGLEDGLEVCIRKEEEAHEDEERVGGSC